MITPRAPRTPFVNRILRGMSSSRNIDKTYRIFNRMFRPIPHRFKH